MKERKLLFDRRCHVIYSRACGRTIRKYIALHYPGAQCDSVFTAVQQQYVRWLQDYRTDLGGKRNFHNGTGGTYDAIFVMAYYVVCREVTSFSEIEQLYAELFLAGFVRLRFVDCNKRLFKRLLHRAFLTAQRRCARWHDYEMTVEPYRENEPLRYRFTSCPVAEFAKANDLLDILPALCNVDYAAMEVLHARLVRTTTLGTGAFCDYAVCGDKDPCLLQHPEYRDAHGERKNR